MKLPLITLALTVSFATLSAYGAQPPETPPAEDAAPDVMAELPFAPMWMPVPKFPRVFQSEPPLPVPSAAYAMIWQRPWQ